MASLLRIEFLALDEHSLYSTASCGYPLVVGLWASKLGETEHLKLLVKASLGMHLAVYENEQSVMDRISTIYMY